MPNDPLADIVRSLNLTGGVFLEADLTAPWAIAAHVSEEDCRPFIEVPKQVIAYHVVTEGEAVIGVEGHDWQRARAGDVVLLPSNDRHTIASAPGLRPLIGDDLVLPAAEDGLARIRLGGNGARTRILCGFIASNAGPSPLLGTLPRSLVIRVGDVAALRWIEASVAMAARELISGRVSSRAVMAQLSELLLVEALRDHVEAKERPRGWLAGMADPAIARALAHIHGNLHRDIRLADLSGIARMSRAAFAQRFSDLTGQAPGRYVLQQRIEAAKLLLRDTAIGTAEIAYRVGYDAPEAFSRAFKRHTGKAPAEWRAGGGD